MPAPLRYTALAGTVLALGLLASPLAAESRRPYQGVVDGSLLGAPETIDPVKVRTHSDATLVSLVFDTLYRVDADGEVEPHLAAAAPEVSEDGRSVRVRLIPGILFHGGATLTAEDVARSLRRVERSRSAWLLAAVDSIRAEGGAVVFDLRRPAPKLAYMLAAPQTAITRGGRAPSFGHADGTGPFRLTGVRNGRVSLERFDHHFAGPPYVAHLELRWYQSSDGEARTYESGRSQISLRGDVAFAGHKPKYRTELTEGPAAVLVYLGFGRAHPKITGDDDFRLALSKALGRSGFRNIGTGERVVPSVYPASPDLGGPRTPRRLRRANMAEAKSALAHARRAGHLGSTQLELLVDRSRPDDREVGGKVVAALFRLGLSARLVELAPRRFAERVERGRCDLYVGQLAAPAPLPELQAAAAFAAGGDDWAEKRLAVGRLSLNEALEVFARRLPILPLFHRAVRAHHRSDLRGVQFDGASRLLYADMFFFGPPETL